MTMIEGQLLRVLKPFWCGCDPMLVRWSDSRGLTGLLMDGDNQHFPNVGLFNLIWLLLEGPDFSKPRRPQDRVLMNNVIFHIQHEKVAGGTLADLAALKTLSEFACIARSQQFPSQAAVLAGCGRRLAGFKHTLC